MPEWYILARYTTPPARCSIAEPDGAAACCSLIALFAYPYSIARGDASALASSHARVTSTANGQQATACGRDTNRDAYRACQALGQAPGTDIIGVDRGVGGILRRIGGVFRSHYLRILRASAVHLRSIICAFLHTVANAPNAEGDQWRSWLSPGCCILLRISDAFSHITEMYQKCVDECKLASQGVCTVVCISERCITCCLGSILFECPRNVQ